MKVAILGYSGSGKSTLAKYISEQYNTPLLYLDTIQFEENWQIRNRTQAISMVGEFMKQPDWVIDGNYSFFLQEQRLDLADYIVYMNFSRLNCLLRCLKRYFKYRNKTRESIAKGCIEKIDFKFIHWVLVGGRTKEKKRFYSSILEKYKTKTIVLKNQKELNNFMVSLFETTN